MKGMFTIHGIPKLIFSDNSLEFPSLGLKNSELTGIFIMTLVAKNLNSQMAL